MELAECNPMYFAAEYHCPQLPAANRFPYEGLMNLAPFGCLLIGEEFISLRANHRGVARPFSSEFWEMMASGVIARPIMRFLGVESRMK
jgi:hypothetical protein